MWGKWAVIIRGERGSRIEGGPSILAAIASGFITDAGPQFWKKTLNCGKMTPPLKTTQIEGVQIIFGPQFLLYQYMWHALFVKKKIGQNRPNMTLNWKLRIGGHHCNLPPCSQFELIPTENRSLSVLLLPAFQKVIFYSRTSPQVVFSDITWSRALGDDWPNQNYKIRPTVLGWRH